MAKEIEIKFKVKNFNPIINRLKLVGGKLEWKGREESFYYDTPGQYLREQNKVLRFRREPSGRNILTLKTDLPKAKGLFKIRNEYQISTDHFKETHRILRHLGYWPWLHYTKKRQHWQVGKAHVELDILSGKKYVEIEGSRKIINQLSTILDLDWQNIESRSYASLVKKIPTP